LPGMKIPGSATHYPLRNEVIQYLKAYDQRFDLPIRTNQKVVAVEKTDNCFSIRTAAGDVI